MKKIALSLAAAACLLGAVGQVQAQSQSGAHAYVVGSFSYTTVRDTDFKEPGLGGRIGFQFHPMFAIEGGADYFGRTKVSGVNIDLTGLSAAAVFRADLAPGTKFRGSFGAVNVRAETKVNGVTLSDDQTEPFFGIGIEQSLNKQTSILGEYRYVNLDGEKVNNFNLGIKFNF